LVDLYPDDLEAKLFLALALISGYEDDGTPKAGTTEALALCRLVLAKDPNHPAAHHYLIHALEASKRPQDAVLSADIYGSLVPNVGHAVHMPGHIYVHVNRWDDAAKVFEASAALDRKYMREERESSDHTAGPYSHNLHFLATVYGYQGRYRDGIRVAQELLQVATQSGEATSRAGLEGRMAMLRMLVRFEHWDDILDGNTLPDAGGFIVFNAWRHFALGLAHLGKGDAPAARVELEMLAAETARLKNEFSKQTNAPQYGIQVRQTLALPVALLELQGRIFAHEGKADEAIALLGRALVAEINVGYSEPPLYPHPMEEVLGQTLLELDRWAEAEKMFRAAMLDLKFGGPMWECAQCKSVKKGATPKADSPAIECAHCKGVPMQYKYVGPSPHSLRASCVVFYLESGMSETEVMKITGHSDIEVFRGYARLSDENLRQSMNAAEEMRKKRMHALKQASKRGRRPALVA